MKILLVDDHEDTNRAIKRLLERSGYSVSTADSVSTALQHCNADQVDVLISDIGLPDGSGLDLMREATNLHRAIKGVALSGYAMEEDIRRSKEAGFAEHLVKPINFGDLQTVLSRFNGKSAE